MPGVVQRGPREVRHGPVDDDETALRGALAVQHLREQQPRVGDEIPSRLDEELEIGLVRESLFDGQGEVFGVERRLVFVGDAQSPPISAKSSAMPCSLWEATKPPAIARRGCRVLAR